MADREPYITETFRTIPLMKGRTIKGVFTVGSFANPKEVVGFRIEFTDGAEVTVHAVDGPLDIARSRGLYPEVTVGEPSDEVARLRADNEILHNIVGWYQDRDFYAEGPPWEVPEFEKGL